MAIYRDKPQFAAGLGVAPENEMLTSSIEQQFVCVGLTSAIHSNFYTAFNATAQTDVGTARMLVKVIQELIRKGVLTGSVNT